MLRTHLFTRLALLFCVTVACTMPAALRAQSDKLPATLLWKITGNGIKKPSYLYGTIHLIGEKDYFLHAATTKAFKKTKRLVTEIDMSNQMAMAVEMMRLAPMKDGKTLQTVASAEEYQTIKNYFEKESKNPQLKMMPFSMVENWKPMLLQSLLYTDMIKGATKSYEMELVALAKKSKMTFGGLETIADQMSVFDKLDYSEQAKALAESIAELKKGGAETGETEFAQLVSVYKTQDVDKMVEESMSKMEEEMKGAEDALLYDRNERWIPLIGQFAKEEPTFFAVGAAHLGGERGVIRLLRKAGYTVEPVDNK